MDQTWQEAREEWRNATNWPARRDIPRPQKKSVDIPEWKLRAIYGNNIPREQEKPRRVQG